MFASALPRANITSHFRPDLRDLNVTSLGQLTPRCCEPSVRPAAQPWGFSVVGWAIMVLFRFGQVAELGTLDGKAERLVARKFKSLGHVVVKFAGVFDWYFAAARPVHGHFIERVARIFFSNTDGH